MVASSVEQVELVKAAYNELLARVAAGRITETDPVGVLTELSGEWARPVASARLAAHLLDYAREQVAVHEHGLSKDRDWVRRQRLYAIIQQVYDRIRLTAPATGTGRAAAR